MRVKLIVFLLTVPNRFICCCSLFVRGWFHNGAFISSSSFGAKGGLCFVIAAFTGYLYYIFASRYVVVVTTVNPRYNGSICSQKCYHYNELAVLKNPKWTENDM